MRISLIDKIRNAFINWLTAEIEEPRELPLTDFERIEYELRPCDVILVEGRSRISRIVRIITQNPWSHAALYIGRLHDISNRDTREKVMQFYQGDPDEQLLIESFLGRGINIVPLTKYKNDHIRICRPKGISRQDAQQVMAYAINKLGQHYAVRQILDLTRFLLPWTILPRRWRSSLFYSSGATSVKETCSSLIAEAFQSVEFPILPVLNRPEGKNVELVQRSPRMFTPSDFDYSPFFEIIKYPIIELNETPAYRKLPWNKEGLLADPEGRVYSPSTAKKLEPAKEEPLEKDEKKQEPPKVFEFFD